MNPGSLIPGLELFTTGYTGDSNVRRWGPSHVGAQPHLGQVHLTLKFFPLTPDAKHGCGLELDTICSHVDSA